MWKLYKLLSIFFIFILVSCQNSNMFQNEIDWVEFEDDNLCMMQGIEFKDEDTRTLYWKCRLRIINQRIANQNNDYGYSLLFKGELKKLRKAIKKKIKELNEITEIEIETAIDEKEHAYCITMRNNGNTDMTYYECREELAKKRKSNDEDILNNEEFLQSITQNDEVILNDDIVVVDEKCMKYVYDEEKLNLCIADNKTFNTCVNNIINQLNQRRIDDKLYCHQNSINLYPDSLFNNQNQSGDMMVGPTMNKNNIIDFRNKEYDDCIKKRNIKLEEYREYLENQCFVNSFKNLKENN